MIEGWKSENVLGAIPGKGNSMCRGFWTRKALAHRWNSEKNSVARMQSAREQYRKWLEREAWARPQWPTGGGVKDCGFHPEVQGKATDALLFCQKATFRLRESKMILSHLFNF